MSRSTGRRIVAGLRPGLSVDPWEVIDYLGRVDSILREGQVQSGDAMVGTLRNLRAIRRHFKFPTREVDGLFHQAVRLRSAGRERE